MDVELVAHDKLNCRACRFSRLNFDLDLPGLRTSRAEHYRLKA